MKICQKVSAGQNKNKVRIGSEVEWLFLFRCGLRTIVTEKS